MAILQSQLPNAVQAELEALRAERDALKAKLAKKQTISFKVSENKGCVSVYGLGRYPVTLYGGQWERLFAAIDSLKEFIEDNREAITWKE